MERVGQIGPLNTTHPLHLFMGTDHYTTRSNLMVRMMGWLIVYFKEDEPRRKVSGMYFFESDMEVPALTEEMYGGIIEHHGEPADETAKMYFYEMQESK